MIGLVTAFDIKADVLVSLALIASVCIGEDFAAGEVAFIMQLGGLLEDLTVAKARAGIEKLVHLTPRTARVLSPAGEKVVPAEEVQVGDLLQVRPGETVPVDGVITSGQTSINQAVMTGESLPVDKGVGDQVSSGTVNQFGAFDMRATRVGQDSAIQRMIRLVSPPTRARPRSSGWRTGGPPGSWSSPSLRRPLTWLISAGNHPGRDHPGGLLPLRPGAGHPHRHHGGHRQRHPPRVFGPGRGRPGAAGRGVQGDL